MARPKKQAEFRYAFVDPKTRHFVVPGTKGAVKVRIKLTRPLTPKKRKRDAKGRFATATKSLRSLAAKKAARTRSLRRKGIRKIDTWQTPKGSVGFESYELIALDPALVKDIVQHVADSLPGKRFVFAGGMDFLDSEGEEFTNFTRYFADDDKNAAKKLIKALQALMITPSDPKGNGLSDSYDVMRTYIVFRFERKLGE